MRKGRPSHYRGKVENDFIEGLRSKAVGVARFEVRFTPGFSPFGDCGSRAFERRICTHSSGLEGQPIGAQIAELDAPAIKSKPLSDGSCRDVIGKPISVVD